LNGLWISKALSKIEDKQTGFGIGQVVPISIDRNDAQALIYSTKVQVNFSTEKASAAQYNCVYLSILFYSRKAGYFGGVSSLLFGQGY